ncbi:MAG: hypothetical protein ABIX28_14485 [Vicinamibacterales bacterium]
MKRAAVVIVAVVASLAVFLLRSPEPVEGRNAPARLSDAEFWQLASSSSENDGTFHSENLVSNEADFQRLMPSLEKQAVPGRAYVGVGSEQNFSYIAAVRPSFAFIVDIRRGNFDLHLLYKALFELASDRTDFVALMFSRERPAGLTRASTAAAIFAAFQRVPASRALYARNLAAIEAHLVKAHAFPLSSGDREGLAYVYDAWFTSGPDIHYELNNGGFGRGGRGGFPTYADLMTGADASGRNRSFLGSEDSFAVVKALESHNLLVPVVGNFGGTKALRAVASYLRRTGQTVSAFYVSNVEQYLRQDGLWEQFCQNASGLPIDGSSVFVRSMRGGFGGMRGGMGFGLSLVPMAGAVAACGAH